MGNLSYKSSENTSKQMSSSQPSGREGVVAKTIERQTSKLPSDVFLWSAIGSMGISAGLQIAGRRQLGNFVGQWAPTLLIFGLYNKLVKVAGSERNTRS